MTGIETLTDADMLELHKQLLDDCARVLARHPPEIQSSVLAELLAIWLGGWPQALRGALLENHLAAVHKLLPHVEVNTPELIERRTAKH